MNFYKHYIGDFQRDTGHLSLTERGAYLALIHHYYATEKPLPTDIDALCRIAGALTKQEKAAVKAVLSFFERTDSGLTHARIEAELHKAGEISNTNREIAVQREAKRKAEREARAGHEPSTKRAQSVPRSEHEQSTHQTPDTRHQKETSPSPEAQEDDRLARWVFDLIAQAVPGTKPPKFDKWGNTIRLMRERDGLTHHRIAEVFAWANRDPFWKTNILSPDKLREKFPQLAAKLEDARGQRNQPARPTVRDKAELAAELAFGPDPGAEAVLEGDFERVDAHEVAH